MTVKQNIAKYPEVWRRFNPRETLMRYLWYLGPSLSLYGRSAT